MSGARSSVDGFLSCSEIAPSESIFPAMLRRRRTPWFHAGTVQFLQRQRAIRTSGDGRSRPASPRLDTDRASPAGVTRALTRSSATRTCRSAGQAASSLAPSAARPVHRRSQIVRAEARPAEHPHTGLSTRTAIRIRRLDAVLSLHDTPRSPRFRAHRSRASGLWPPRLAPRRPRCNVRPGSACRTGAGLGLQNRWILARATDRRVRFPCVSAKLIK